MEGPQTLPTTDKDFKEVENALRVDFGCGSNKREGFIGVDEHDFTELYPKGEFQRVDLDTYPWPFETSSIFEAHASHIVEHVPNLINFMEEMYRVLQPQGTVQIVAPYWNGVRAWQDPTHVRAITEATFSYFDQEWLEGVGLGHYNIEANFKLLNLRYYFMPEWQPRAEEAKMYALKHYSNVVADIEFLLQAVK